MGEITFSSSILSPLIVHTGCFHLLANVNSAAVSVHVRCLFAHQFSGLWGIYLEVELLGHAVM